MEPLTEIPPEVGESGEEYEMLIAFTPEYRSQVESLAASMDLPLTLFGRIAPNAFRYPCRSHHF
jgi:thiamine monophosphate kinase